MTNLDSILKSRDITLLTNVHVVKSVVFSVVMYGYESWTIKKAKHRRIDAFELWSSISLLSLSTKGQTDFKPQSQKINQSDHMDHGLVQLSETMSHAVQGHPRWTGHGGEF